MPIAMASSRKRIAWPFVFAVSACAKSFLDLPGFCGERLAHFAGLSLEGDGALEAER